MKFEWEVIQEKDLKIGFIGTARAKVIGGWLVHHAGSTDNRSIAESMVFVPDPNHEWSVE